MAGDGAKIDAFTNEPPPAASSMILIVRGIRSHWITYVGPGRNEPVGRSVPSWDLGHVGNIVLEAEVLDRL